ncbi:MAG: host-nuclease inhibitor Gam family protein [Spirochaetota bacterium]|jgi:phage host-nuclease inhibitor protein Gam
MKNYKIETLDDANNILYQIALAQIELDKIDIEAEEKIKLIQKQSEQAGKHYRDEIQKLEELLLQYAENHKEILEETNKRRSQKLTFGIFGFRKSSRIEIENEAKTIELIEITKHKLAHQLGLDSAIVREPKIKKTVLQKFDDETLKRFGILRIYEDTFFYETDRDAVNLQLQKSRVS